MASEVDICNQALYKVGASTILALSEPSENARKCNAIYAQKRDKLLRSHPWNFAINRATLAQLDSSPAYDYDHAYQLPTLPYCLRVLELKEERDSGYAWRVEGRTLVTDSDSAIIKYIAKEADTGLYDPVFIDSLILMLAADLAVSVANSRSLRESLLIEYSDAIEEAKFSNAMETLDEQIAYDEGSWILDR
jgi:hypothetical protein